MLIACKPLNITGVFKSYNYTPTITAVGSDGFKGSLVITVVGEETENPGTENPNVNWSEYAELKKGIVQLINEERRRLSLNELEVSEKVMLAAEIRADECTVLFDHTRPNGKSYNTVFKDVNLSSSSGEIIAKGFSTAKGVCRRLDCISWASQNYDPGQLQLYWRWYRPGLARKPLHFCAMYHCRRLKNKHSPEQSALALLQAFCMRFAWTALLDYLLPILCSTEI